MQLHPGTSDEPCKFTPVSQAASANEHEKGRKRARARAPNNAITIHCISRIRKGHKKGEGKQIRRRHRETRFPLPYMTDSSVFPTNALVPKAAEESFLGKFKIGHSTLNVRLLSTVRRSLHFHHFRSQKMLKLSNTTFSPLQHFKVKTVKFKSTRQFRTFCCCPFQTGSGPPAALLRRYC